MNALDSLLKTVRLQGLEACEVTVVGKDGVDAVLPTERYELRVEYQIAACIGSTDTCDQQIENLGSGLEQFSARGGDEPLDERSGLGHGGRRIEQAPMSDHSHELNGAEDRKSPPLHALSQGGESQGDRAVQIGLAAMGVDEDVGVYGDHGRTITS